MQPTREIEAFIARVNTLPAGPGISLDSVLQPSLDEEAELRNLFATDKKNDRLSNPHVGLVDVFDAPDTIRTTRARVVGGSEDLSAKYVMPITDSRRDEGEPSIVNDLEEFKKNWAIFTEGSLSQLVDWNNVVAAGGSVLACLTPLDEADKISKRAIRKYYHSNAYPTSDVDLFLWGLTPEQADAKIKSIYEAVRDSVPWDVTCIRTKHTVSIHSQYPYRSVQIVLRLYQSPAEILAGFDIDAPCCAYDGDRVWANPRAIVAMMRQCNTVDMTRRSPSYEVRLAKYSQRSFEVYVPTLERSKIDPTIYERSIARMEGLARLLALEKLSNENMRSTFLEGRRQLRGRLFANALHSYSRRSARKFKGDLKAEKDSGVVEMNDYDVASLHIPYGPGWDARRIDKLIYQTDLGMNSTFNPKNKGRRLHRHPAFFGTIEECLEDCCGNCPKAIDDDEKTLQAEEDEKYIRGRIQYIEENPGRQTMSGSFKPIDVGEWSDQVYIKPTQALFSAISAHDRTTVQKLLGEESIDVNQRDHVGRTSLHVAIFSNATDIALDLIDAGARITARIADGRTPLHLAAQFDQLAVIRKLFEKNAKNVEEAEKKNPVERDEDAMDSQNVVERPSSEDDWSSHEDEDVDMVDADEDGDDNEEDEDEDNEDEDGNPKSKKADSESAVEAGDEELEEDQPDIINVNESDWDFGFTALSYAVLFASVPTLDALFAAGADVKLESKPSNRLVRLHPLTLTILRDDEDEACKIAEHLLKHGATSSTANDNMRTIFHAAVYAGRMKLVETMLRCDPHSAKVIDFPLLQGQNVVFPIVTAINKKHYGIVALLLAHDAKIDLDEKDITRAQEAAKPEIARQMTMYGEVTNYLKLACQPVEVALKNNDDLTKLLINLGASVNFGPLQCLARYSDASYRRTIKEWVDKAVSSIENQIREKEEAELVVVDTPMSEPDDENEKKGWKGFYSNYYDSLGYTNSNKPEAQEIAKRQEARREKDTREQMEDIRDLLVEIQTLLNEKGAKGWSDVYPTVETQASADLVSHRQPQRTKIVPYTTPGSKEVTYVYLTTSNSYDRRNVPQHLVSAYDELYDACYTGDNDRIQRLCLPVDGQGSGLSPLNISVRMVDASITRYDQTGYTPLFAAIAGRRWSTAKLILAIATAQYHPSDDKDKIKFNLDMDLDDDSDNESCNSDESDITVEQQEIKFVDIATRPSAVQCEIHPKRMLSEITVRWTKRDSPSDWVGPVTGTLYPLAKAVADHDLDAFVHIANLYQTLPEPLKLGVNILDDIIAHDQTDILDEYIRRTGEGVNIDIVKKDAESKDVAEEELPLATNDANKMYLGLDVHGKKRMDLATKNDPNASHNVGEEQKMIPILWKAIRAKSKNIIKYFASDKPLEAYKAYSTSVAHGDVKAIWLRRHLFGEKGKYVLSMADTQKKLSAWVGWKINSLGESPLIAALIPGDLDLIKLLTKLEPELMTQALKTKIKFVGINILQFAIQRRSTISVIDYLLAKGVSPAERDSNKGWNIYHYICNNNNTYLLEFFLKKLPKEVTEELLKQQSKVRFNTPLHVAVKNGHVEATNLILLHSASIVSTLLQMRDVDGQTPLHCAVRRSSPGVAKVILDISNTISSSSPLPLLSDLLHTEDSVGLTPLEITRLNAFSEKMRTYADDDNVWRYSVSTLNARPDAVLEPRRVVVARCAPASGAEANQSLFSTKDPKGILERGLEDVKELLARWEGEGKEMRGRVNVQLLRLWVGEMEKLVEREQERKRLREEEEEAEKKEQEGKNPKKPISEEIRAISNPGAEHVNVQGTHKLMEDAVTSLSGSSPETHRHLIHLLDVQRSVHATIIKASTTMTGNSDEDDEEGNYRLRRRLRTAHRQMQKHGAVGELEAEDKEAEEKKERRMSMVFQHISAGPDTL